MAKDNSKVTTNDTAITRSSSAAYLTFIAATREGGVETIYADETICLAQKMMGTLYNANSKNHYRPSSKSICRQRIRKNHTTQHNNLLVSCKFNTKPRK